MASFTVALWAGLSSGREAEAVLVTAMIAMFVCQPIGLGLGYVFRHAVEEQLQTYKSAHPIPEAFDADAGGTDSRGDGEEIPQSASESRENIDSRTENS